MLIHEKPNFFCGSIAVLAKNSAGKFSQMQRESGSNRSEHDSPKIPNSLGLMVHTRVVEVLPLTNIYREEE